MITLEAFDTDHPENTDRVDAYQEGYDAGFAAGLVQAGETQAALQAELVQSISDLEFTYREARGDVTRALAPLIETLVSKILPQCIDAGFAMQIHAVIMDFAEQSTPDGLTVTVHPDQIEPLSTAISQGSTTLTWAADATLTPHAAWIKHESGEALLDLDGLLEDIAQVLNAIHHTDTRRQTHG